VTHQLIGEFHAALDTVEAHEGPCALILCNDGKFFSNGLSFEALIDDPEKLLNSFHTLLGRLLGFPIPTVAAINGHAFAGGAMMALACDFRVMNKEKGFICVNEIDIGLALTPGMCGLLSARVPRTAWVSVFLNAERVSGKKAVEMGLVNAAVGGAEVGAVAVQMAEKVAKRGEMRKVYGAIKKELLKEPLRLLQSGGIGEAERMAAELKARL